MDEETVPDMIRRVFGSAWCDDYVTQAQAERVFDWIDEHDTAHISDLPNEQTDHRVEGGSP